MLSYTEIKPGKVIVIDDEPYLVTWTSGVVKKQRQKPHNTAKLKNLISSSTIEKTFTQSDKIEEAELETKEYKYIFNKKDEFWFQDPSNPKDRFFLSYDIVQDAIKYIKEGDLVDIMFFEDEPISLKLPIKVSLEVVEAPPNIKGNTSAGGSKVCVTETGLKVVTPLFIEVGDKIIVNTQTGEYIERAK